MLRIIYSLLLLVISICSMASVVWLLSFIGFELLLVAGACFIAFASSVTLAEEVVEWCRHREASSVQRQLLPPAS
jgi:NADH:ubiquinone oxidoreductase subunit 6 (subunit J)